MSTRMTVRQREGRLGESRAAARREHEEERNPFLLDDGMSNHLPALPTHPDWHFCYVRHTLDGKPDGANMVEYVNDPRFQWSYLRPEELLELTGMDLRPLKLTEGQHSGYIGVHDVVAMKCPMKIYLQYLEACAIRGEQLRDRLREDLNAKLKDKHRGARLVIEDGEREETIALRDEEPERADGPRASSRGSQGSAGRTVEVPAG